MVDRVAPEMGTPEVEGHRALGLKAAAELGFFLRALGSHGGVGRSLRLPARPRKAGKAMKTG